MTDKGDLDYSRECCMYVSIAIFDSICIMIVLDSVLGNNIYDLSPCLYSDCILRKCHMPIAYRELLVASIRSFPYSGLKGSVLSQLRPRSVQECHEESVVRVQQDGYPLSSEFSEVQSLN